MLRQARWKAHLVISEQRLAIGELRTVGLYSVDSTDAIAEGGYYVQQNDSDSRSGEAK